MASPRRPRPREGGCPRPLTLPRTRLRSPPLLLEDRGIAPSRSRWGREGRQARRRWRQSRSRRRRKRLLLQHQLRACLSLLLPPPPPPPRLLLRARGSLPSRKSCQGTARRWPGGGTRRRRQQRRQRRRPSPLLRSQKTSRRPSLLQKPLRWPPILRLLLLCPLSFHLCCLVEIVSFLL